MTPARGLNKAQQEAYLASVKAFQDRRRPKGPTPSGGGFFDQIGSFMKNNPNKGGGGSMGPRNPNQPTPKPPRPGMSDPRVPTPRPMPPRPGMPKVPSTRVNPPRPPRPGMTAPSPRSQSQGMGMAAADKGMYGAMGLKKGGMATKKKAGKISEYGGKEMYSSKKGMMKHEGMESMKMEKSEGKMKQGGMAKKGRGMAIMIAIGKPKGRGKS